MDEELGRCTVIRGSSPEWVQHYVDPQRHRRPCYESCERGQGHHQDDAARSLARLLAASQRLALSYRARATKLSSRALLRRLWVSTTLPTRTWTATFSVAAPSAVEAPMIRIEAPAPAAATAAVLI